MKLKPKFPKFSFRTITSGIFIIIVIVELLITFNYLYRNLRPEPPIISEEKIIRADLKGYSQIYTDLKSRETYEASKFIYTNPNPFKYGP